MERGGRRGGGMVGLLVLQALSEYGRLDRKPPVTAGLIAANTLIYLRPKFLDPILPTLNQVWFNPHLIVKVTLSPLAYLLNLDFLLSLCDLCFDYFNNYLCLSLPV